MPEVNSSSPPFDVLVIDNDPDDLNLLTDMLSEKSYHVRPVTSGLEAIKAAKRRTPDLILLDLIMPEMDGFDVLDEFKRCPALEGVPVIVVSGIGEPEDKLRALQDGAVDFITKPYEIEEIRTRIANHLNLCQMRRELSEQHAQIRAAYSKLEKQEALRDQLTQMLTNHLSMPLSAVSVALKLALKHCDGQADAVSLGLIREGMRQSERMAALIEQLLAIRRLEDEEMPLNRSDSNLIETLNQVREDMPLARDRFEIEIGGFASASANFDDELISKVVSSLLERAANDSPKSATIRVRLEKEAEAWRIVVCDSAPPIPKADAPHVWRKFWTFEQKNDADPLLPDSGLSLTWCQFAVEAHGGSVGVNPVSEGKGNEFWFSLPHQHASEPESTVVELAS
ncbi:MAG: two-component system sensor histidine kinase/response regulator [Verrucomicrobiales bacterium]|jgi:two-component system sensor histidine kinase/response regulator